MMTQRWDFERVANELDAQAIELLDWSKVFSIEGDALTSTLAREAGDAVRSFYDRVEAMRARAAAQDTAERGAIEAHLMPGETVGDLVAAAIVNELSRRRDAVPA